MFIINLSLEVSGFIKPLQSFGEDQSRIRKDNAPANAAIIRHAVLNMIRQTPKKRMRVKRMRKAAGWNDSLLTEVLAQVF